MDGRMQRFDSSAEHFCMSGQIRNIADGDAVVTQYGSRSSRRHELHQPEFIE